MTTTLVSLISIFFGILGGNSTAIFFKKYSFDFLGNTIAGVFGSVFFIKSFGRLGFSPQYIIHLGNVNYQLFSVNSLVSFLGGLVAVVIIYKLKIKMNRVV